MYFARKAIQSSLGIQLLPNLERSFMLLCPNELPSLVASGSDYHLHLDQDTVNVRECESQCLFPAVHVTPKADSAPSPTLKVIYDADKVFPFFKKIPPKCVPK